MQILFRGDSSFCREEILKWCKNEARIDHIIGIAKNARLKKMITTELTKAKAEYERLNEPYRIFKDQPYTEELKTLQTCNQQGGTS